MDGWLLAASLAFGTGKSFTIRMMNRRAETLSDFLYGNLLLSFFTLLTVLVISLGSFRGISGYTWITAFGYGLCIMLSLYTYNRMLAEGPIGISLLFNACSFIIPTVLGTILWKEKIYLYTVVGLVLMLGALILCAKGGKEKMSVKWLTYTLLCTLFSGLTGFMQKLHQSSDYKSELGAFLTVAYALLTVMTALVYLFVCRKEGKKVLALRPGTPFAILGGVVYGILNQLNTYLAGALPSAVFFPIYNGGLILLCGLMGWVLFKEKMTIRQIIGTVVGLLAIVVISGALPFFR